MNKNIGITFFLLVALLMIPVSAHANSTFVNRGQVLEFLQEAFQAQVKLSEKERSQKEIEDILSPYFSKQYQELFFKENLVEMDGKYIIFGSDFAPYYIPFFQFSDRTKVASFNHKFYVYEYFPGNVEGPVSYKSHYEGILIEQFAGVWKVSDYLYDNIPDEVINQKRHEFTQKIINNNMSLIFPYITFKHVNAKPVDLSLGLLLMEDLEKKYVTNY